jgi:hypothetical protein
VLVLVVDVVVELSVRRRLLCTYTRARAPERGEGDENEVVVFVRALLLLPGRRRNVALNVRVWK